jgi:hypothetical protein
MLKLDALSFLFLFALRMRSSRIISLVALPWTAIKPNRIFRRRNKRLKNRLHESDQQPTARQNHSDGHGQRHVAQLAWDAGRGADFLGHALQECAHGLKCTPSRRGLGKLVGVMLWVA